MFLRWVVVCLLTALSCLTARADVAAQTPARKPATSPKRAARASTTQTRKTVAKKTVVRKAAARKTPVRRTAARRTVAKKPVVRRAKVTPIRRTPADLPVAPERASVQRGCFGEEEDQTLMLELGMSATELHRILEVSGLSGGADGLRPCTDYVLTTGGAGGAASAMFLRDGADPNQGGIVVTRSSESPSTLVSSDVGCVVPMRREFILPARDHKNLPSETLAELPLPVQWEIGVLTREMTEGLANPQAHQMRVVLEQRAEPGTDRLLSLELVEIGSGRVVDGAWWVERTNGPGLLMGTSGVDYERLLWLSSVDYTRMSRGVGTTTRTVLRRVPVKKNGKTTTRAVRVVVPGRPHLGVDFAAPRGTDVRAVGEGRVAYAGRRSDYGNLVILDHGGGYQTYYAHLSKIAPGVKSGVALARGEVLGAVGSTGRSTGPHLHFEVRKDGKYVDPFDTAHQLDLWVLRPEDQTRLLKQVAMLDASPSASGLFANAACVVAGQPVARTDLSDRP